MIMTEKEIKKPTQKDSVTCYDCMHNKTCPLWKVFDAQQKQLYGTAIIDPTKLAQICPEFIPTYDTTKLV